MSHPGQLSLAIPPWVSALSTSQRAVMLCCWGVKPGMVREWVASDIKHPDIPISGDLAMGLSHNRALYKRLVTRTFTMSDII